MRKIVVVEYVSLDGVVQAPGHPGEDPAEGFVHGGWTGPFMGDHRHYMREPFRSAGAILLGRLTYEIFASYWPSVTDESDEIASALNSLPKYVASTTMHDPGWPGTTVLPGDVVEEVTLLKEMPGKCILVVGSAELAQTLMRNDLIDEYQLWLHPIVLGGGKRLFRDNGTASELKLVDATTTRSGLVMLTYEPARPATDKG